MKSIILVVSVLALAWLPSSRTAKPVLDVGFQGNGRPECPMDWRSWHDSLTEPSIGQREQDPFLTSLQVYPFPPAPGTGGAADMWSNVNIPEFNDCQRFIVEDGLDRRYTKSFFAVFANLYATRMPLPPAKTCQPECGEEEGSESTVVTRAWPTGWVYAEEGYEELAIAPGANCLLLHKDRGVWKARMVAMETSGDVNCMEDADPTRGIELLVRTTTEAGFDWGDYPSVARWDRDPITGQYYIGITCGNEWCEVGNPSGFSSSRSHPEHVLGPTREDRRIGEIKGWYDEQHLAVYDPVLGLQPSAIIGTIFPDPELGDRHEGSNDFSGGFKLAARVALRIDRTVLRDPSLTQRDTAVYRAKFNFVLTEPYGDLNEIHVCNDADCPVPEDHPARSSCVGQDATGPWWAKIRRAGDLLDGPNTMFICIRRHGAPEDFEIPGTVRWRWLVQDEGEWVRCLQGCCEILGGPH